MAAAAARVFRGCRFLMSPAVAAGGKRPVSAAAKVTKTEDAEAKEKRGIMQPVPVSDALRRFAGGAPEISRAGAVKLIWAHTRPTASRTQQTKGRLTVMRSLKAYLLGGTRLG